ncbi:MAG: sulfatase [Opitutaceae bacterium]
MRLFFTFILLASGNLAFSADGNRTRPNLLILLADDLGAMDVGFNNPGTFYETPHLDRLAREGVRFTSGYAPSPVCSPTRFALQTGRYATRAGVTNWLFGVRDERFMGAELANAMPRAETTLAEVLRPAGYRTAFVGKWHLGDDEKFWPEHQGYEFNVAGASLAAPSSYFAPYQNPRLPDGPPGEFLTERLATESVRLLERLKAGGKPFLLVHSFYQVHTPLEAPQALVRKYEEKAARLGLDPRGEFSEEEQYHLSATGPRRVRQTQSLPVYAAMVEAMDTAAGRILQALSELGLAENTLVIFTSDNGGLATAEGSPTTNLPLRGGKGWLYEGGIREPFVMRWPAALPGGASRATPVSTVDIFPTALDAAQAETPAGLVLDGRSLLPAARGESQPGRDLFWHYPHYSNQGGFPGGAIRRGQLKLIENYEDGSVALYDLAADPGEKNDVAPGRPADTNKLRTRLHAWYRETGAKFLRQNPGGPAPWRPDGQ